MMRRYFGVQKRDRLLQVWGANGNKKRLGMFVNVIAESMKHWVRSGIALDAIETDHLVRNW
jgi:hypothetical protein